MPLGNLTSQFFANVYLNELDQFVKHELKAKYYIRYVDDFVILSHSKEELEKYKEKIDIFLKERLSLQLHPDKSKILILKDGINFLGFRVFYHHKLLRKKNMRKFERKLLTLKGEYESGLLPREKAIEVFEGWLAYSTHGDTYKYRRFLTKRFNQWFPLEPATQVINVRKQENFKRKVEQSDSPFSTQKTLFLWKKGITVSEISKQRNIKESTVWEHLAKLIEHNYLKIYKVLPAEKTRKILSSIKNQNDKLTDIKQRLNDQTISFNEIQCVLASVKAKNKKKNVLHHIKWCKRVNCYRKCYSNPRQRNICSQKFETLLAGNPNLELTRDDFLELFNNHLKICVLPYQEKIRPVSWKEFVSHLQRKKTQYTNPKVKPPSPLNSF